MTYLSKNRKEFKTIREAEEEDRRYDAAIAAAEKQKNETVLARANRKKEVDEAFKKMREARDAYMKLVRKYNDDYGVWYYNDTQNDFDYPEFIRRLFDFVF